MAITASVTINLEMDRPNDLVLIHAVQGEYYSRQVTANLKQSGVAYTIPSEAIALIRYRKPDGKVGFYDYDPAGNRIVTIINSNHSVQFTIADTMCDVPGRVFAHIDLYSKTSGNRLSAFYFYVDVEKAATDPEIVREANVTGVHDLLEEIIGSVYTPSATPQEGAIIDNTLSIPGAVGDAKAMGDVILIQDEEPDSEEQPTNKIWIDSDSLEEGIEVPDMDDIVNAFSTSITYKYGDYTNYDGHIYKYIAETASSGAWDNSKWELAIVCDDISELKIQINSLECVPLDAYPLTNGNLGSTGTWNNMGGSYKHYAIPVASGDVVTFTADDSIYYGVLKTYNPVNGGTIDYSSASGFDNRLSGSSASFTVPSDGKILVIENVIGGSTKEIRTLQINGYDITKSVAENIVGFYGYNTAIEIPANSNINNYTTFGVYAYKAATVSSLTNFPYSDAIGGVLIVRRASTDKTIIAQEVWDSYCRIYTRSKISGVWSSWVFVENDATLYNFSVRPKSIANNTDFDTIRDPAIYSIKNTDNYTHSPFTSANGVLIVRQITNSLAVTQEAISTNGLYYYRLRDAYSGAWTEWKSYLSLSDIYGMAKISYLPANTDFNNLEYGAYWFKGGNDYAATFSNCPVLVGGQIVVSRVATSYKWQEVRAADGKIYSRYYVGSWTPWVEIMQSNVNLCKYFDIEDSIREAVETVVGYNEANVFCNIAFCTDTHIDEYDATAVIQAFDSIASKGFMDVCVHGGDIATCDIDVFDEYLQVFLNAKNKFTIAERSIRFVKGNHEMCIGQNKASIQQIYMMLMPKLKELKYNSADPFSCYYYEDFEEKKVRAIYLDAFTTPYTQAEAMSNTEMSWLYNTALDVEDEWTVIVFAHYYKADSFTKLNNILNAFNDRGTTYGDYTFDNDKTTHLVGVIYGHVHHDESSTTSGFNTIGVTKGFSDENGWGFDILTIDTVQKKLFMTRIGTSGADREFQYT